MLRYMHTELALHADGAEQNLDWKLFDLDKIMIGQIDLRIGKHGYN